MTGRKRTAPTPSGITTSASEPITFVRRTPATFGPNEEFRTPSGEWYNIYRAICLDSWLIWKDALPDNPYLWDRLNEEAYEAIRSLGARIHALHQLLPNYRRLSESPFTVSHWWDPVDDQGWDAGDRCLLKIEDYTSRNLPLDELPGLGLGLRQVSEHWMEFSLPT